MARRAADSSRRLGVVAQEQEFPARRLPAPARLLPLPRWRAGDRMLNGKASLRRTRKGLGNQWPSLRRSPCLSRHFRLRIERYQSFAAPFSGQLRAAFESERWSAVLDHTILTYVLFHYAEALNGARIVEGLEMFRKKLCRGKGDMRHRGRAAAALTGLLLAASAVRGDMEIDPRMALRPWPITRRALLQAPYLVSRKTVQRDRVKRSISRCNSRGTAWNRLGRNPAGA
jgi:hypothetical protein